MLTSNFQKVQEFNRAFDMVPKNPTNYPPGNLDDFGRLQINEFIHIRPELFTDNPKIIKLRLDLINEEIEELNDAIKSSNFTEIRDALADILYVVYGMADVLGINIDELFITNINNKEICQIAKISECCKNKIIEQIFPTSGTNANNNKTNRSNINLTNFTCLKIIYDTCSLYNISIVDFNKNINSIEDNLKIIQSYINVNYKKLEQFCLSDVEKKLESFHIIGNYIYNLLKYVYTYSYIACIDADADFEIVHSSNMSKLCDTESDANITVIDYFEKYIAGISPYDSPYYYELPELRKWIVKNKSTGKALKNIKYKKVDFS